MLPAIVFIFSRAQCEDAVRSCMRAGIVLTSMEEESEIRSIVERHCESLSFDDRQALEYDYFLDDIGTGGTRFKKLSVPIRDIEKLRTKQGVPELDDTGAGELMMGDDD